MQKGSTLIEVILALLLFSTCMLGSGFFVLKSIHLSKLAFEYTEVRLSLENLANMYMISQKTERSGAQNFHHELALWQQQFEQTLPLANINIQLTEEALLGSLSWKKGNSHDLLQKYARFQIDKQGQLSFS